MINPLLLDNDSVFFSTLYCNSYIGSIAKTAPREIDGDTFCKSCAKFMRIYYLTLYGIRTWLKIDGAL